MEEDGKGLRQSVQMAASSLPVPQPLICQILLHRKEQALIGGPMEVTQDNTDSHSFFNVPVPLLS